MKIERLLTIIVILLNRKQITAKELADRFDVSVRTIYRDIDSINMAGIPVISYPGANGGYGIMDNYKLNHQLLTLDNLASMLSTLSGINSTFEDTELNASIEKLRSLVPTDKSKDLDMQMEQIIIDLPVWGNTSKLKQMLKSIRLAISNENLLTIKYRNYNNFVSSRQIEPMSVIFKGYSWYLYAYCHLKSDFRIFRLSRIINLAVERQNFVRRNSPYNPTRDFSDNQDDLTVVTLKFSPQARSKVDDIFDQSNIKVLDSGELLVTASFPEKDWSYSLILSFGENVEVLEPDHIRQAIQSKISAMYSKYL